MGKFVAPSAKADDTLRAVSLALKLIPRQIRNDINRESRKMGNAAWRGVVNQNARTETDRLVLAKGARVKPGNPLVLTAATSKRKLSGGLVPNDSGRAFEFGAKNRRGHVSTYDRRNRSGSGTHKVARHTRRGLPQPSTGRVIYESAAEIAPRISKLWVEIIVRNIYKAHEGN